MEAPTRTPKRPAARKGLRKTGRRPKARPLQKVNLVEEVVARLREEVLAGHWSPGEQLPPEGQLAETFNVSRTVVREAMRILGAQGLVEVSQGRRPRVKPPDPGHFAETIGTFMQRGNHSLLQLLEVRVPLETAIAALAAQRATAQDIAALESSLDRQATARTLRASVEADIHFHDVLAQATHNQVFQLLLAAVAGLLKKSREQTISRSGNEAALTGHQAIVAAVKRKDPKAARKAMREHLSWAAADLATDETPRGRR